MAFVSCNNLTVGYEGRFILKNLSFEVEKGDYLCIIGSNGSGKSTLMKTILSLIKPYSGSIVFDEGLSPNDVGYLPQQTIVQKDFPSSVYEIVISGCLNKMGNRPFYNKKEKDLALKNMEKLSILDLKSKNFKDLSGGQKQRVLLSRALCASEKLLLLDEPVAGLDPKITQQLYSLVADLNKNYGLTIIMITHDLGESLKFCNKVLKIGDSYFFGTKEEYLAKTE